MERWTCPNCKRTFGKKNQSHLTCEPAISLEEYFSVARPFEKPIFDAVISRLGHFEGLIVDPLNIGILLKNGPMFAELRPKTRWTALGFHLPRKVRNNRFSRKIVQVGKKHFHVINILDPAEIDDEVIEWLTEAYHLAGGTEHLSGQNRWGGSEMVPDDVDDEIF